jgi:hypothetical protein
MAPFGAKTRVDRPKVLRTPLCLSIVSKCALDRKAADDQAEKASNWAPHFNDLSA